jgi:hypothetical protein
MDKCVAVVQPALAENDVRAEGKIANAVMRTDSSSLKEACLSRRTPIMGRILSSSGCRLLHVRQSPKCQVHRNAAIKDKALNHRSGREGGGTVPIESVDSDVSNSRAEQ